MLKDMCEKWLTDQHIRAPTESHSRTSEERERIQQHYKEVALCPPHSPASSDLDQDMTKQALQNKMTQYLFHWPECIFHDYFIFVTKMPILSQARMRFTFQETSKFETQYLQDFGTQRFNCATLLHPSTATRFGWNSKCRCHQQKKTKNPGQHKGKTGSQTVD